MAFLKPKMLRINQCLLRSIANSNVNKVCGRSFSTIAESTNRNDGPLEVTESPELPIWVRLSENSNLVAKFPEDDFVLPSISYWIENYKQSEPKGEDKSNKPEIDAAKTITKILVKHFESVDAVVQALNNSKVTPTETLVTQMLRRFDNNWKSAYGVFIWAESHKGDKFPPDMYDLLVDTLGKSNKFDLMWQVVEQMVHIGDPYVTINTMTKVIRRLGKAGRHEDSIDAFRRIEQYGVRKDLLALNVLVDSLAKEKNVERANEIFLEFRSEITPNSNTYNSLIHGWSKARNLVKAQTIWDEMKENGISPDVVSYTSLIEAYCCEKDFRKVDKLLEEMQEKGCHPNIITYTIIMHALGKSKEIDEALKVYEKAEVTTILLLHKKTRRLKTLNQCFCSVS